MKIQPTILSAFVLILAAMPTALAVAPDECEQQRAQYPNNWNEVARERPLFMCASHYSGSFRITIGASDRRGRTLMSLVPLRGHGADAVQDTSKDVYRIWLDREQTRRLMDGRYFATILRRQNSCWIRGSLSTDSGGSDRVFFMDNARDHPDGDRAGAGSFYNKAPRFSVFEGDAYTCTPVK